MTDDLGFVHRILPSADAASRDTLLTLHGTGGDENDLISLGQTIAPGAAILSPRGNVLENGAPRFFKRLAEGVFDPQEVRSRAEELAGFVQAAIARYALDPERIFVLGYSNGANAASTIMFIRPRLIKGAILLRPMLVYEPEESADLSGSSVFISAGRMDPIVPAQSVERLAELFQSARAKVTLKWQMVGHNLVPSEVSEASAWLALQRSTVSASL
ncbi:MAG TPA: alpha/beta hydrolase [Gemmatimonadaceae bacterium]